MAQSDPRASDIADHPRLLAASLAGRYRLERELGQGGMATVYLAQDLKHDRQVAIKVLKPELAAVLGAERFVQEIKTTAALQHPNILPLFDSGEAGGFLFYVMPYVEGETLRGRLDRETQLGVAEAVKLTTEVADALQYAHEHGVVHRDIKPENILLHAGRPVVADFGIALAVSAAAGGRMTETGLSLGTPHYMSPEQATAEKEITGRSDIYSLGSVLYEMLAGNPPHTGASAQQIIMKIVTEEAVLVTRLRKAVPANVAAAVSQALEKLPADRFESAKAFADALGDSHFAERRRAAAGDAAGATTWKRRFYSAAGACAVLLIVAGYLLFGRGHSQTGTDATVRQMTFGREHVRQARWAPDGKTLVYSAKRGGSASRLYVVRPDYPEPQPLGPDSVQLLAVSPTGELAVLTHARHAANLQSQGTLARMPLGGGAPRDIMKRVREADWSPNGSQLAVARVDPANGTLVLEYPIGTVLYRARPGENLSDVRVSPNGDRVAFFDHELFGDDRGVLKVVDTGGRVTTLTQEFAALEGLAWEPGGRSILFSGRDRAELFQVHRATIGGDVAVALPSPGALTIQDIASDGTWLVTRDDHLTQVLVRAPGSQTVRDVSWLGRSYRPIMSRDGKFVVFCDQGPDAGPLYATMMRKTDGSPAVRLGEGCPAAISPDDRSVLANVPTKPPQIRLYPTGAGQTTAVNWKLSFVRNADFSPDGQHLFVCGETAGKRIACYQSARDGSALKQLTPDSVAVGWLRGDGGAVAYWLGRANQLWVKTLADGRTRRVPNASHGFVPLRWSPDGTALWGRPRGADSLHYAQLNIATGRISPLVTPNLPAVGVVSFADDPNVYAYGVVSVASLIFSIRWKR